jgi:hypothetical protein
MALMSGPFGHQEHGPKLLWFRPVHPLNWQAREVLLEQELPSRRWNGVTRYLMLFVDSGGLLVLLVGYKPANDSGNIDNVRCFKALLGPANAYPDPHSAVPDLEAAAQSVEAEFGHVLVDLFGAGLPEPIAAPLPADPAAARLRQ